MKTFKYKITTLFILLFSLTLFSCQEDTAKIDLLKQAQSIREENPKDALSLLSSIENPEDMETARYMEYIVTLVQTKYEAGQDISGDTLILIAQKYFEINPDISQAALANFYAGHVNYRNGMRDKAFISYIQAEHYAQLSDNNTLIARSLNNIAYMYYEQDVMDSAIVNYEHALDYCNKQEGNDPLKMKIMYSLGSAYIINDNFDNALTYYQKGLDLAEKTNNKYYKTIFKYHLGVTYYYKENYNEATNYLHTVLAEGADIENTLKVYLSLSKLYYNKQQLDSVKYYTDLTKNRLPEIKDNYTLKSIYGEIANYNKEIGNFKEAVRYADMRDAVEQKIKDDNKAKELYEANTRILLQRKQKELEESEMKSSLQSLALIAFITLLIIFSIIIIRALRRKYQEDIGEIEHIKMEYLRKKENLLLLYNSYANTMMELIEIDQQARMLVEENKDPSDNLYTQHIQRAKDIKQKTTNQLISWAKDYVDQQAFKDILPIAQLNDEDILLMALSGNKYSQEEISIIMDKPQNKVYLHKMNLKILLEISGLSEAEIADILNMKDNSITK